MPFDCRAKETLGIIGASTDFCLKKYGGLELSYTLGTNVTFQFDLCKVIKCGRSPGAWRGYDVYLCGNNIVWTWTGPHWQPHPSYARDIGKTKKVTLVRGQLQAAQTDGSNPLLMSISNLWGDPHAVLGNNKSFFLVLGVDQSGKDSMGLIKVNLLPPPAPNKTHTTTSAPKTDPGQSEGVVKIDYSKLTRGDIVRLATGYGDKNMWLEWMAATAASMNMSNCIACSSARPTLYTTPAPLFPVSDPMGFHCMVALTMQADPPTCATLSAIFPPVKNSTVPPVFTPKANNYTCFSRNSTVDMGHIPDDWCKINVDVNNWQNASSMVWGRADLFWYCGDRTLHINLPPDWSGKCAMVRLGLPLFLLGQRQQDTPSPSRRRRDTFDIGHDSTTYMDAIGVPRGVPDEYKLVDQVAAGFENIPFISSIFPVTPNKNVDRINYIHYNVLRLANKTRDAVAGLSEQLAATSLMTVQNRMALDMLLAEKGGVCSMFNDQCCTFIPNNTAPDGSVTRALEGLRSLSEEMHEHSGIDNPLGGVLGQWFGKWKSLIVSVFLSLVGMMAVLALCGCCCIPCLRSLFERLIVAAIEKKSPPPYQMAQLEGETTDIVETVEKY
uniref:Envelope protein n=1 Tax=Myripristis murdjan TaxID=586833 RepID=A0A667WGX6_9TELE